MYSRSESREIRTEFWTTFGTLMKPHLSAEGIKVNWVNYKTGVSQMRFKMEATEKEVSIGIYLHHKDDGIRELYYEQLLEFVSLFASIMEEEWTWQPHAFDEHGAPYAALYTQQNGNVFDKNQWPEMFAFLKQRLLRLDAFWCDAVELFKAL